MKFPHTTPAVYPTINPGRFAATIQTDIPARAAGPARVGVALLGLPDDTGVQLNKGRPGAKDGPRAFREALARYGVADPLLPQVYDCGDIIPAPGGDAAALDETHDRITAAAAAMLETGLFPIAIGGGHDLTFPFVRAVARNKRVTAGVYYDAHLDVRPEKGSGMPFRSLVEGCGIRQLTCIGFEPFVNSAEHAQWFGAHGGTTIDVRTFTARSTPTQHQPAPSFVSLDMDCFPSSAAPGVSALNPIGLPPALVADALTRHGADPNVHCFDIMELNPAHDIDARTARLAAHMFLSFLRGLAQRPIR